MTKPLVAPPVLGESQQFCLRNFRGQEDVGPWLDLRRAAFAHQRLGVREWTERDFEAEFLAPWWWRPERMWLAEPVEPSRLEAVSNVPPPVIGTVTLAFRGTGPDARPVVHWLAVHPRWRRRGVGRALMARLENECWTLGYRQIWLETHAEWRSAAELYRALGYVAAS